MMVVFEMSSSDKEAGGEFEEESLGRRGDVKLSKGVGKELINR